MKRKGGENKKKGGKRGEKGRKREKKSVRGKIITKSDTERGKRDIFSPNLYITFLGGKISFRKGWGGEEYDFWGNYIPLLFHEAK